MEKDVEVNTKVLERLLNLLKHHPHTSSPESLLLLFTR